MNPLFSSLPLENKIAIFQSVSKDKDFSNLVQLVSKSNSFLDQNLIDFSSEIAIRISQEQGLLNISNKVSKVSNSNSSNFFNSLKAKTSCGDPIPDDSKAYPVDFYPVFVDYTEKNLEIINSKFCQDSYQIIREDTGNKSIQVASFTSLKRANAFKEFLFKAVRSGEVGKPRRVESRDVSSLNITFGNLLTWLVSPVNAQSESKKLEYSVTGQFNSDGTLDNYPLWHGVELQAIDDGIKIVGTSLLAQQVVVLPAGKLKNPVTKSNFIGLKNLDSIIVSEALLEPAEIGIYSLNTLNTIVGSNRKEIVLKPENSEHWKPGKYDVFLSAGSLLNRTKKAKLGAWDINISLLIGDIFSLPTGIDRSSDFYLNFGAVTEDCSNEVGLKTKDLFSFGETIVNCLRKPDNLVKLSNAFGIDADEAIAAKLLQFDSSAWKTVGKKLAKVINITDKAIATSRIAVLGQYINHENSQGIGSTYLYQGTFSVVDPTQTPRSGGIGMSIQQYGRYLQSLPLGVEDKISFSGAYGFYPGGIPNFSRPSYYTHGIKKELSDGIILRLSAAIESKDRRVVNRVELELSQKSRGYVDNLSKLKRCPVTLDRLFSVSSSLKIVPGNAELIRDDFVSVTAGGEFQGTEITQKEYRSGNTFFGITGSAGIRARTTGGPPIDELTNPCSYVINIIQSNGGNEQRFCNVEGSSIQSYCIFSKFYDRAKAAQKGGELLKGL